MKFWGSLCSAVLSEVNPIAFQFLFASVSLIAVSSQDHLFNSRSVGLSVVSDGWIVAFFILIW